MMQLRYYQQNSVDSVYRYLKSRDGNPCVVLPTGCHVIDHPILMYNGTIKKVQDIRIGDKVMGNDSTPRNVLALCRGHEKMYRIKPFNGNSFVVNENHILSLVSTNEGKRYPSAQLGGEITNISIAEYLTKSKSWKHLRKLYRVSVDFSESYDLPVPPYILGLLLGDGSLTNSVSLTSADEELGDEFIKYANSINCCVRINESKNKIPQYYIRARKEGYNYALGVFDKLGLLGHRAESKFVPEQYLRCSRDNRLELLAGLMDSDGYSTGYDFDFVTKSQQLADDLTFLARSLGFYVSYSEKYSSCQTGAGGWYYRVRICGDCNIIPCRRKRHLNIPKRRQKKDVLRTGFTIEELPADDFYGFTLDGNHLYVDGNFFVHHNSGKSHVLAQICSDAVSLWNGRVLVVTHVKELVEQNNEKIVGYLGSDMVGIYSAGLNKRQGDRPVTTAGIQSIYKKACEFDPFDLVIIDECHLLPPEGDGMYRQFLKDAKIINPNMRVIGLTATPYRMTTGLICGPDNILNEICYEVGVKELIAKGYLCPLKSKSARHKADTSNLHIRGGEFIAGEVKDLMDKQTLVDAACREIVQYTRDRSSVIIFASSVAHAKHVKKGLLKLGCKGVAVVTGKTSAAKRAELISLFKNEQVTDDLFGNNKEPIKYLVNVNVLTTGFDAPNVDCVVLLRPTNSPGLYYQMVGRGLRLHPNKTDCLVLDFGGNIMRHGPIDAIQASGARRQASGKDLPPAKECPSCCSVVHAAYSVCPDCGFEFPSREGSNHEASASTEDIISGEPKDEQCDVKSVEYSVHIKRNAGPDDPTTMRVDYMVGWRCWKSEWVCFEHTGYAKEKARQWWMARSDEPVPETVEDAVELAVAGALAETHQITVRTTPGRKFDTIVGYALGEKPDGAFVDEEFDKEDKFQLPEYVWPEDDIPF